MLIEISMLPIALQQQILNIEQGQTIQFANHGKVVMELYPSKDADDSLNTTSGMWQGVDGLAYQQQIRNEWD
ncbi:MAG: hypothetical protein Q4D05_00950 [Acinetobacter sp.]|nr:hypothetical protein [Acinetobacter sp.]